MRALPLALGLLLVPLSGCFDADPPATVGQPTSLPAFAPVPVAPTRDARSFNASDPGYRIATAWSVGDGWDWESNETPYRQYRTMRVLERQTVGDHVMYRVEETYGRTGSRASGRNVEWIDGTTWALVNVTDSVGSSFTYDPPKPLRFYRNATFAYNESGVDRLSGQRVHNSWFVASFVEPEWEVVRLGWGQVAAFRVAQESFAANLTAPLLTQWVSPDYANPIRYSSGDVMWTLVAANEGGRQFGALQPT